MNFTINRHLFTTKRFDSGSLGILTSIVHQFKAPGVYRVTVLRNGVTGGTMDFEVNEQSLVPKLSVDLSKIVGPFHSSAAECHCAGGAKGASAMPVLSPQGYVIFSASGVQGGYAASVAILERDQPRLVYTTEELQDGDYFALSLMEPGDFSMTNTKGSAKGTIEVKDKTKGKERQHPRTMATVYVESHKAYFKPDAVTVMPAQGLVFSIKEPSRIVVSRTSESAFDEHAARARHIEFPRVTAVPKAAKESVSERKKSKG